MPIVEPVLNLEKARQLLDEGSESAQLDYKRRCDLHERRDIVEIAKDFAALQLEGGYVVVGADNTGVPTGEMDEVLVRLFDEATLRDKLKKYIPEPFSLLTFVFQHKGNWIAALGTLPNPAGLVAMRQDGTYREGTKDVTVFRKGDVYVRHGSKSERCDQADILRAFERIVGERKEAWLAENLQVVKALAETGALGRTLAASPAAAFSWRIDADAFGSATLELIRTDDRAPILTTLDAMKRDAATFLSREPSIQVDDLRILLDRLACVVAIAMRLENQFIAGEGLKTFTSIYALGFEPYAMGPAFNEYRTPQLWLEVVLRIMALGAYAVRLEKWDFVRRLGFQAPGAAAGRYSDDTPWLRHGLTEAARANLLIKPGEQRRNTGALISLSLGVAKRVACLRPDVLPESDALLNSLLQFDLIAAIIVMTTMKSTDTSYWYPSFGFWSGWRSEPILVKLLSDETIRAQLLPCPLDPEALLKAVWSAGGKARETSLNFHGWESQTVHDYFAPVRERLFGES